MISDGEVVVDLGFGLDHIERSVDPETLFPLYCAGKPVVSLGILRLVRDGELSLDDQLGHLVADLPSWLASATVEMLLTHSAGLHEIDLVLARLLTDTARQGLVRMLNCPIGWRAGVDHAYATYGSWHLLGEVIEEVAEEPFDQFLQRTVLHPYGVGTEDYIVRFSPELHATAADRISVTIDFGLPVGIPLLAEAGIDTSCEWNPAYGAYATMGGLAQVWQGVLADLEGAEKVLESGLVSEATTTRTPEWHDESLSRSTRFGLGIMTDLESVLSQTLGPGSFGHTGLEGCVIGFADPSRRLVIASAFNGLSDMETAHLLRREPLLRRVLSAIDEYDR